MIGIKKERNDFDKKIKDIVYLKQKGKIAIYVEDISVNMIWIMIIKMEINQITRFLTANYYIHDAIETDMH